mgnify:CR=1 FL=1
MNERERLIELLLESEPIKDRDLDDNWYDGEISDIADYLLQNGVIVPPVKVGDTVYTVSKKRGIETKMVVEISWKRDCAGTDLGWGLILSGKRSNNRYNVSSIGKTVFLTKEQAEKALQGGAE